MKKFKLKLKNPARELEGNFYTVECVFSVVIWAKFRLGQSRKDFKGSQERVDIFEERSDSLFSRKTGKRYRPNSFCNRILSKLVLH